MNMQNPGINEKMRMLEERMRVSSASPKQIPQNNFANVKSKVEELKVFSQNQIVNNNQANQKCSLKKEDIFQTPPGRIKKQEKQSKDFPTKSRGEEQEEDDEECEVEVEQYELDQNSKGERVEDQDQNEGEEASDEMDNEVPSNEKAIKEKEGTPKKILKGEKENHDIFSKYEPKMKKMRVDNSQKMLFQENTFQENEPQKQKNNKKNGKSKITAYLNNHNLQDQIKEKDSKMSPQELQKQLRIKDTLILNQKKEIDQLQAKISVLMQAKQAQQSPQTTQSVYQDPSKIKKIIQTYYIENSQLKRKLLKIQLQQAKQRLGEYAIDGVNFKEKWIEGFEVQDLLKQIKEVEKKIQQLQIALQNIKSKKAKGQSKSVQKKLVFAGQASEAGQLNNSDIINSAAEDSEDEIDPEQIMPSKEDQKKSIQFQISMLEKQKEIYNCSLEQKRREAKEIIKKFQLQYLEENSRFGGLTLQEPWKVLGNRYQLSSLLGKGGFSEVYKALDLDELKEVAVKIHYIDHSWSNSTKQNYLKHAFREHGIQKELNHPNIVKLYDYIEIDNSSFASVLEYCEGPDLSEFLKIHSKVSEADAKFMIKKILDCLVYLNSFESRVIHYDLKPQNVIFHKGQIKITDFGLSKILEDNATRLELTSQGVGTYWYLPPECFGSGEGTVPKISSKVDIWSLGVIFYEMLFGIKPFGNKMSQQQILQSNTILNSKEVTFPAKPQISKDCHSFIIGCLRHREEERYDINQALAHPYFKKN